VTYLINLALFLRPLNAKIIINFENYHFLRILRFVITETVTPKLTQNKT